MNSYGSHFQSRNVMITGGLGFIGSNLARRLVELGAKVLLVDSLIPEYGGNFFNIHDIKDKVQVNIADMRDENGMNYLVRNQDYIFNLAGQVSHIDSMRDPYTDLDINCRSQLSMLEACRKNNPQTKIVYASTRQIYGIPDYLPVDENHILHPTDVNGINKMAGEWYHIVYNNVYGIRATSLRLTNTYGPGLLVKHNRQGFIGWFIRLALQNEQISLFGDGSQIRDFSYVDDIVEAFLLAAVSQDANGQVFNLGGETASLKQFLETLIELSGKGRYSLTPFPEEMKKIDIRDYFADYSKISRTIGWAPKVGLHEGLRKTVEYYREYGEHYWS